eukprot:5645-Pelagomonas_calceolata.AAC.1
MRVERSLLKSASGARRFIGVQNSTSMKLQSKPGYSLKKEKNHVGSESTPCINLGKGNTLAQRAVSLPHQRIRGKL